MLPAVVFLYVAVQASWVRMGVEVWGLGGAEASLMQIWGLSVSSLLPPYLLIQQTHSECLLCACCHPGCRHSKVVPTL